MAEHLFNLFELRAHCRQIFNAALRAVEAGAAVKRHCRINGSVLTIGPHKTDLDRYDHIYLEGACKATASMALAIEDIIGKRIDHGIISVKYGHTKSLKKITIMEAAHPVPYKN